jgi:hypothetical protein
MSLVDRLVKMLCKPGCVAEVGLHITLDSLCTSYTTGACVLLCFVSLFISTLMIWNCDTEHVNLGGDIVSKALNNATLSHDLPFPPAFGNILCRLFSSSFLGLTNLHV